MSSMLPFEAISSSSNISSNGGKSSISAYILYKLLKKSIKVLFPAQEFPTTIMLFGIFLELLFDCLVFKGEIIGPKFLIEEEEFIIPSVIHSSIDLHSICFAKYPPIQLSPAPVVDTIDLVSIMS